MDKILEVGSEKKTKISPNHWEHNFPKPKFKDVRNRKMAFQKEGHSQIPNLEAMIFFFQGFMFNLGSGT